MEDIAFPKDILWDENIMEVWAGVRPSCSWDEFPNSLHGKLGRKNWQSQKAKAGAHVTSGAGRRGHSPSTAGRALQFALLTSERCADLFCTLQIVTWL